MISERFIYGFVLRLKLTPKHRCDYLPADVSFEQKTRERAGVSNLGETLSFMGCLGLFSISNPEIETKNRRTDQKRAKSGSKKAFYF